MLGSNTARRQKWDVFISHASEDKDAFVRPFATALQSLGVSVWYDEFSLKLGDSLLRSIDRGILGSRFGIIVISPAFIRKQWPEYELKGLVTREIQHTIEILPIWHGVDREDVVQFSPSIADRIAARTDDTPLQDIAMQIFARVRPDLYDKSSRDVLERARMESQHKLESEIERFRAKSHSNMMKELKATGVHPSIKDTLIDEHLEGGDTYDTAVRKAEENLPAARRAVFIYFLAIGVIVAIIVVLTVLGLI